MKKKLLVLSLSLLCGATLNAQNLRQLNNHTVQIQLPSGQLMYLDFYGENIFRLYQSPKGEEIRDPQATPPAKILVDNPRKPVTVKIENGDVKTARLTLDIDEQTGCIEIKSKDVEKLVINPAEFQKNKTILTLSHFPNEYFYGGGVQNGRFSHKNKVIAIENTNNWVDGGVASPTPFYWSTGGYGVMAYTFSPGKYDFESTEKGKTTLSHDTDYLDYFFMFDKGAVALLNDFYQLTGNPVLLPKFGFYQGHLNAYNRDYWTPVEMGKKGFMAYEDGKEYNESQKDNGGVRESLNGEQEGGKNYQFSARAAIDRYLDNDYPLGWFLPNDGYGAGYGQTSTLDGNIQNLKEFGDYARSKGVEIGLWTQSDLHPKEGVEALLQRDIVKEVRDAGVRVLKTDVAWVGAGYSFGLNGVSDVAQIMPYYGNEARPFIISLDGWAGTQRYAGIWTGDQTGGEWEYIRFHIPTYIGSGLSGQPNITSDMDGIFGGKNIPVNVRDYQWKTFSPMQLNMDGWGSNPKYPQALGEPAASINRWYLKWKSALMPYTYSIARESVDGMPMIRAMFLAEENAYTLGVGTQYQFLYGPNILVAPIYKNTRAKDSANGVKDGDDVRDGIYLPAGEWVDYFTGDVYQGGRVINDFPAPLWKLPVFVRRGAIIPVTTTHNTPEQRSYKQRIYNIYPGPASQFSEYDDDGRTQAYLCGECATTLISQNLDANGQMTICVAATSGQYEGMEKLRSTRFVIPMPTAPKKVSVKVGGKTVRLTMAEDITNSVPNTYAFVRNVESALSEEASISQLVIDLGETDVTKDDIVVKIDGVQFGTINKQLAKHGALQAPVCQLADENRKAYSLTPSWQTVDNADYYEIMFRDVTYSTIHECQYQLDGLQPLTQYEMKVRAVNADGQSEWTVLTTHTCDDPLRDTVRGVRAETTCANQGGQGVQHLFDFDETSTWHTAWANDPKAVPFDLTIDLRSVNHLDKLLYMPRPDAGNGTILKGTWAVSMDRQNWSEPVAFEWARNGEVKELSMTGLKDAVRFVRIHVTEAVGSFGSGQQMYIFRQPGSEFYIPGDINNDLRIDENDLTSFLNYTGLRKGDGDFDYISRGDLNQNGLIDAYDISTVAIELETGVSSRRVPAVEGTIVTSQEQKGDELYVTVSGKGMKSVNAISLAIPYDATQLEYVGVDAPALAHMYNMTYDRLHTNGQKSLYPTFVNLGEQPYLEGDQTVMVIHFHVKQKGKHQVKVTDGMLVDKYQDVVKF